MQKRSLALLGSMLAATFGSPAQPMAQDGVKLNQIQVIGTHNSYHSGFAPSAAKFWQGQNPQLYQALDYRHAPLTAQLDAGVRQIELDIFADPQGGMYAHPYGEQLIARAGLPPDPPFDPEHIMDKPGFKVLHVQDIDYRATCQPFTACLAEVRAWAQAHPHHIPVFILVETKEGALKESAFPSVTPLNFTPELFDALDAEIRSVFSPGEMVTPDQVRGTHATLNEAVLAGNWPALSQARGKVIFLMDQRKETANYTKDHPSLRSRVLFTNGVPGEPDAAFTEENDAPAAEIDALARQGYLIRTRSDSDTKQARANDTTRRDAVLASGAQMISTDYPWEEPASTGFTVALPGHEAARCNPVTKPPACQDAAVAGER